MSVALQCRHLLEAYGFLFDGLTDAHRAHRPVAGGKTAGWLVGHLAVTGDFGLRLCGAPTICPREWRAKFNPGTQPSLDAADYPPMEGMVARLRKVYAELPAAFENAGERLRAPNPSEVGRAAFPISGDFVAYLMTGHLGYHLGQLSGWRAAAGM